jgi:hypothetical protein
MGACISHREARKELENGTRSTPGGIVPSSSSQPWCALFVVSSLLEATTHGLCINTRTADQQWPAGCMYICTDSGVPFSSATLRLVNDEQRASRASS